VTVFDVIWSRCIEKGSNLLARFLIRLFSISRDQITSKTVTPLAVKIVPLKLPLHFA